jgi:hypothetical protein
MGEVSTVWLTIPRTAANAGWPEPDYQLGACVFERSDPCKLKIVMGMIYVQHGPDDEGHWQYWLNGLGTAYVATDLLVAGEEHEQAMQIWREQEYARRLLYAAPFSGSAEFDPFLDEPDLDFANYKPQVGDRFVEELRPSLFGLQEWQGNVWVDHDPLPRAWKIWQLTEEEMVFLGKTSLGRYYRRKA